MRISTSNITNATTQQTWQVLSNVKDYGTWNPFIRKFEGELKQDITVAVKLQLANSKTMIFKPKLIRIQANSKIVWLGKLFVKGLFDGNHHFETNDSGNRPSTFIQSEKFRGILIPFLKTLLIVKTKNGFELMNEALKKQMEQSN
jgi:hypothetical protein